MDANQLANLLRSGAVVIESLTINTADNIFTGAVSVTHQAQPTAFTEYDPWAWRYADLERSAAKWQQDYAAECAAHWQVVDQR